MKRSALPLFFARKAWFECACGSGLPILTRDAHVGSGIACPVPVWLLAPDFN